MPYINGKLFPYNSFSTEGIQRLFKISIFIKQAKYFNEVVFKYGHTLVNIFSF